MTAHAPNCTTDLTVTPIVLDRDCPRCVGLAATILAGQKAGEEEPFDDVEEEETEDGDIGGT